MKTNPAIQRILGILTLCFLAYCGNDKFATYDKYVTSTYLMERGNIPDSVFQMKNLDTLVVTGMDCNRQTTIMFNKEGKIMDSCYTLKEIPTAIGGLKQLQVLSFTSNAITEIPPFIAKLVNLRVLALADNPIHTLPKEIAELKDLRELYLQDCLIDSIAYIDQLTKLEKILLQGCPIRRLPDDLRNWKHLKLLNLHRTKIQRPEQERIRRALPDCRIQFPDE